MRHTEDFILKKMIWIYMIITSLATTALAKGSVECNLATTTEQQCFGEFGAPLILHLPTSTTKLTLTKDSDIILKLANNTDIVDRNNQKDRKVTFFNSRTLKFNKASREDSGDYVLQIYDSTSGDLLNKINIHIKIKAKPAVSQTCLSPEQMKVSCSSEGDGAEIILSLDNNVLIHSRPRTTGTQNVTISLHGQLTGILTCDVQHNVSREQTVIQLTSCSGNLSPLTAAVIASVSTLLLLLVVFLGIKRFNKTTSNKTTSPVTAGTDDAEEEVIYSDVRVKTPARKTN